MLRVGSPHLEDITLSALIASREESNSKSVADTVSKVSYALFSLGIINETLQAPNAKRQERSEASKRKKVENIRILLHQFTLNSRNKSMNMCSSI